jgi:hypothetical protein
LFSTYLKNALIDHALSKTAFTMPANMYLVASTTTISADGTGITEPSGNGYARREVLASELDAAAAGSAANNADLEFAEATGSWGDITDIALMDASSGGNLLMFDALPSSKTIGANDVLRVKSGQLTASISDP